MAEKKRTPYPHEARRAVNRKTKDSKLTERDMPSFPTRSNQMFGQEEVAPAKAGGKTTTRAKRYFE